jgi:putative cell wall-binding protein
MTNSRRSDVAGGALRQLAILSALAVAFALLPFATPAVAQVGPPGGGDDEPREVTSERFAGSDRYETARLIAEDTFEDAEHVVIAKAEDWPDALAGNFLAGVFESPVLLVSEDAVQQDTLEALESLDTESIFLLGGTAAISEANEQRLRDAGYEVERIRGATRYETAATIATRDFDEQDDFPLPFPDDFGQDGEGQRTAIVATGQQFADALVAGSVAFSENFPVLLTPSNQLHPAASSALDELEIEHVIIPGGTAAVSAEVASQIEAKEIEVTRIFGGPNTGRVETAIAFADYAEENFGYSVEHLNFATADPFADALAMGPHAGTETSPLLLTTRDVVSTEEGRELHPALQAYLEANCVVTNLHIAGGQAAVTTAVENALIAAAEECDEDPAEDEEALTFDVEDGDEVTYGDTITATLRDDIVEVSVESDCTVEQGTLEITEEGDERTVQVTIANNAEAGECEINFTSTDEDGATHEQTLTVEIVADADGPLTFDVEENGEVQQGATITATANEQMLVNWSGACVENGNTNAQADEAIEISVEDDAELGECEIQFQGFGESGPFQETLTVTIVAGEPNGDEGGNG